MTRQEEILKGFNESWGAKGLNVSFDTTQPSQGVTVNNPAGGRALLFNLISSLPSVSMPSDTWANWETKASNGELTAGQFVLVTDLGDLGLILQCTSASTFSTYGNAGYLNADFQMVGDYSGVSGFAGAEGLWLASNESGFSNGSCVVWNQKNYVVTDAGSLNGTNPVSNTSAYSLLGLDILNGYIAEWDFVEFSPEDGLITARLDKRGNYVYIAGSTIAFDWGNDNVKNCNFNSSGAFTISNIYSTLSGTLVASSGSNTINIQENNGVCLFSIQNSTNTQLESVGNAGLVLTNLTGNSFCQANNNNGILAFLGTNVNLTANDNTSQISMRLGLSNTIVCNSNAGQLFFDIDSNNSIEASSNVGQITINAGTFNTITANNNPSGSVIKINAQNGNTINYNDVIGSKAKTLNIGNNSTFTGDRTTNAHTISVGNFSLYSIFRATGEYNNVCLGDYVYLTDEDSNANRNNLQWTLSGNSYTLADFANTDINNKTVSNLGSDMSIVFTANNTGLNISGLGYVGIFYLTNSGAIAINSITAYQKFPIILQPLDQILTVTFGNSAESIRNNKVSEVYDPANGAYLVVQLNNDGVGAFQCIGDYPNV